MSKGFNFMIDLIGYSPRRLSLRSRQQDTATNLFLECLKVEEDLMMVDQSPKKQSKHEATNDKECFSNSSHKREAPPSEERKNPYSLFYQDQQRNLFKQSQKAQIIELSFIKQQRQIQHLEEVAPLQSLSLSQEFFYDQQYNEILRQIDNHPQIVFNNPVFLQAPEQDNQLTKLLLFRLNKKNGRRLQYDEKTKTIRPLFRCEGCKKEFKVSSALGGHLSKCEQKEKHFQLVSQKQWIMDRAFSAEKRQIKKKGITHKLKRPSMRSALKEEHFSEQLFERILKGEFENARSPKNTKWKRPKRGRKMKAKSKRADLKRRQQKSARKGNKNIRKRSRQSAHLKYQKMNIYQRR